MMGAVEKIRRHGVLGSMRKAVLLLKRKVCYIKWRFFRHAPGYHNPTLVELETIERDLAALGVAVESYSPNPELFKAFQAES